MSNLPGSESRSVPSLDLPNDAWMLYRDAFRALFGNDKPIELSPAALQEMIERLAPVSETETTFKDLYFELLYAVANKYPGEDRHATALRYIQQAERQDHRADQAMSQALNEGDGSYKP